MLTLIAALSLAHAAPARPAEAASQQRTACDGLGFVERLSCIKENYPKIHARVEGLCSAQEGEERRACREKEYGAYGIAWGKAGEEDAGERGAPREGSRSRSSGATSATATGTSSAAGSRSGASSSTSAASAASPATGTAATGTAATGTSASSTGTSTGSASGGSRSSSASGTTASGGVTASSLTDVVLNPTAVSVATVSLTLAGSAMQQAPSVCANSKGCGLSKKEQSALSTYGGIIATQAATLPGILGSSASDGDKASQVLTVLADMAAKAPTGLGGKAQGYVDAALAAIAGVRAAAGG